MRDRGVAGPMRERWFAALTALALAVAVLFLTVPVIAVFANTAPGDLLDSLGDASARDALRLSLETSAIALALIVLGGPPPAYRHATRAFRAKPGVAPPVELPLVLPPAVAGIALLASLGPS